MPALSLTKAVLNLKFLLSVINRHLLAGALCYYLALPPLNWWFLAFLVPVFWGQAVIESRTKDTGTESRPAVRCLLPACLTAFVFWVASIWWIACPHPVTSLGLVALSAYLSLYWVLFFYSARLAVHRFKIPAVLAVPVCWMGCEYLRCHLLGGFSFCALEHSLYKVPLLIQLAGFGGQYLVGGMMMFYGMLIQCTIQNGQWKQFKNHTLCIVRYALCVFFLPAVAVFGYWYSSCIGTENFCYHVAALQGNIPISLSSEPDVQEKTFKQFFDLAGNLYNEHKKKDEPLPGLIIFPETVCPFPILEFKGKTKPADLGLSEEDAVGGIKLLQDFVDRVQVPALFGLSTYEFYDTDEPRRYNTALLVKPNSPPAEENCQRYDKIHLVMFGEYIPFSEYLPDNFFLKTLCQEAGRGKTFAAMKLDTTPPACEFVPNICFESSVPHFIRNQVLTLREQGKNPKVLVNISNDAWFRFSRQIDQHLATHVFRAVENRMWYITATNGGFSAMIDGTGEIRKIGKRGAAEAVEGSVCPPENIMPTVYQTIGDLPAGLCAALVLLLPAISLLLSASIVSHKDIGNSQAFDTSDGCK